MWTPTSLTYMIDGKVYWTQTNSATTKVPWRCASYRFILRTDGGLATPASDDTVYLRRFKYSTLQTYLNNPLLGQPAVQDSAMSGLKITLLVLASTIFVSMF